MFLHSGVIVGVVLHGYGPRPSLDFGARLSRVRAVLVRPTVVSLDRRDLFRLHTEAELYRCQLRDQDKIIMLPGSSGSRVD